MIWVRRILAYLLSLALLVVLLVGVLAFNINAHFAKPDNLQNWLSQSQFYNHFVSDVIGQPQISLGGNGLSETLSLSDATVQQAAANAFPPQLLQSSVNQFLAANYAWLQGKTTKPQFSIDLSQAKQNFANQVGQYVQARLASLPICSASQLASLPNTDLLMIPCRPANIAAASEAAQIKQQLASSSAFLTNPVLTADNLQPGISQPYYQKVSFAPKLYRWSSLAPIILAIMAVILALAILLILPRRKGLRKLAGVLLLAGLLLIATKFSSDYVFNKLQARLFNNSSVGPLQSSLTDVVHRAETALTNTNLYFGVGFIVAAVIILAALLINRHRQPKPPVAPATAVTPLPPSTITTPTPLASTATGSPQTQPKAKRPRLIQ